MDNNSHDAQKQIKFKLLNPKHYFIEFKALLRYSANPVDNLSNKLTVVQKIQGTWTIFVLKMVLAIVIGIGIALIYDPANKTTIRWREEFSTPVILFLSVFLFPLIEEIGARLSMIFNPIFLSMTSGVIGYHVVTKIIYGTNLSNIEDHFEIRILTSIIIIIVSYPILSIQSLKQKLTEFWQNNFRWIFYLFCIYFSWTHIFNYEPTITTLLLMPLITLPKLVSALCYGYIRMNYGFSYSLGLHMFWNCVGFLISMIPAISSD